MDEGGDMDDIEAERTAKLKSDFDADKQTSVTQLPFELLDKQTGKTIKLFANSGSVSAIPGRSRWFDFSFKQPVMISKVSIKVDGYSDNKEFEIKWEDENGTVHVEGAKPASNTIVVFVNDLCRSISFKPPSMSARKTNILSVMVEGIERANINKTLEIITNIDSYRRDIRAETDKMLASAEARIRVVSEAEGKMSEIGKDLEKAKGEHSRLKKSLEEFNRVKITLIANNAASESSLGELVSRTEKERQAETALISNIGELEKKQVVKTTELAALRADINLFPSEISGFVNQGDKNIKQYLVLVVIPMVILIILMIQLFTGAVNLTTIYSEGKNVNLQLLVVSRLPYVTVAIAIITVSYRLARASIIEIFKINRQRLNLTKISIIAKDVSAASGHDLGLTDDKIYRLRTELKMQLLREHLKEYISTDTEIRLPTRIFGLLSTEKKGEDENVE